MGKALERWKELKELNIFKSDAKVALYLLDRWEASSTDCFCMWTVCENVIL